MSCCLDYSRASAHLGPSLLAIFYLLMSVDDGARFVPSLD